MAVTKYTKMRKAGELDSWIEPDKINRFLSEGWTIIEEPKEEKKAPKSKGSKNKITADAQVTSKASEEAVIEEVEEDEDPDAMDTLTFSYDDFETAKKED